MSHNLTNLLPQTRRRAVLRDYRMRVAVVALIMFTILVVVAAVLLIPTYLFLVGSANAKIASLSSSKSQETLAQEQRFSAQLSVLAHDTARIESISKQASPTSIITTVLAVARPGVKLLGVAYQIKSGKTPTKLNITGVAATRSALRNYQLALKNLSFVTTADLPVSAYAAATNIPFSISLTLTL